MIINFVNHFRVDYIENIICTAFLNIYQEAQSSVEALGEYFYQYFDVAQLDIGYNARLEKIRNESWESDYARLGNRVILYRSCAQTSWFQTSKLLNSSIRDKFLNYIFIQGCIDAFGSEFNEEFIENGNSQTNARYGGMNPHVENVYITYGGLDPYQYLGPAEDLNPISPVDIAKKTPRNFIFSRNIKLFNDDAQNVQKNADELVDLWILS